MPSLDPFIRAAGTIKRHQFYAFKEKLDEGLSPNARSGAGSTLLRKVISEFAGSDEALPYMKLLLDRGARLDYGEEQLLPICCERKYVAQALLLLAYGANPNVSRNTLDILEIARKKKLPDLEKELILYGATSDSRAPVYYKYPESCKDIVAARKHLDMQSLDGKLTYDEIASSDINIQLLNKAFCKQFMRPERWAGGQRDMVRAYGLLDDMARRRVGDINILTTMRDAPLAHGDTAVAAYVRGKSSVPER